MAIAVDTFPEIPTYHYTDFRSQIRSGDILLCSGSSFFSHLIQQATHSVWSHVAFVLQLQEIDRIMVLESVEEIGVRTVPLSAYANNYNGTGKSYPGKVLLARHAKFVPSQISKLSEAAINLLGYPYGKEEILYIAARIGFKAWRIPNLPEIANPMRAYICSEYAYECYKSVGIAINYDEAGFIAPADFAKTPEIEPVCFIQTN